MDGAANDSFFGAARTGGLEMTRIRRIFPWAHDGRSWRGDEDHFNGLVASVSSHPGNVHYLIGFMSHSWSGSLWVTESPFRQDGKEWVYKAVTASGHFIGRIGRTA